MDLEKKAVDVGKKYFFDPSNVAHVLYLAVFAIVAVLVAAVIVIGWRAQQTKKTPYTKHPTSQLVLPARGQAAA